jgi:hypothetical protein
MSRQRFRGEPVPTEAELARREGRDYEPASVLLERIWADRPPPGACWRKASTRDHGGGISDRQVTPKGNVRLPPAQLALKESPVDVSFSRQRRTLRSVMPWMPIGPVPTT